MSMAAILRPTSLGRHEASMSRGTIPRVIKHFNENDSVLGRGLFELMIMMKDKWHAARLRYRYRDGNIFMTVAIYPE